MKAILRTNDFKEDYQIVIVLKNPISENNSLALIEVDGNRYMTGGILCEYDTYTISVLDEMTPKQQWDWLLSIMYPKLQKV